MSARVSIWIGLLATGVACSSDPQCQVDSQCASDETCFVGQCLVDGTKRIRVEANDGGTPADSGVSVTVDGGATSDAGDAGAFDTGVSLALYHVATPDRTGVTLYDVKGSSPTVSSQVPSAGAVRPRFSPAGNQLAVSALAPTPIPTRYTQLYSVPEGTAQSMLPGDGAAWDPMGGRIATLDANCVYVHDLRLPPGLEPRCLPLQAGASQLSFAPQGARVAYLLGAEGEIKEEGASLVIQAIDGATELSVSIPDVFEYAWSGSDSLLVLARQDGRTCLIARASLTTAVPTLNTLISNVSCEAEIAWASTGMMAFSESEGAFAGRVYTVDTARTGFPVAKANLAPRFQATRVENLTFTPDGAFVVYAEDQSSVLTVVFLPVASGAPFNVAATIDASFDVAQ